MSLGSIELPYVEVSMEHETEPRTKHIGGFVARYLYGRSREGREHGAPGQDFIVCAGSSGRVYFAVCDGVSQSFFGNLAARLLGLNLVKWLKTNDAAEQNPAALKADLAKFLTNLTEVGTLEVREFALSDSLGTMLRDVLERKRQDGSESTFACGALARQQNGATRMLLAWMGNTEIQLFQREDDTQKLYPLQAQWTDGNRWSTRQGPMGDIGLFTGEIDKLARVAVFSDGLQSVGPAFALELNDAQLWQLVTELQEAPSSDDAAWLEIKSDPAVVPIERAILPPLTRVGEPPVAVDGALEPTIGELTIVSEPPESNRRVPAFSIKVLQWTDRMLKVEWDAVQDALDYNVGVDFRARGRPPGMRYTAVSTTDWSEQIPATVTAIRLELSARPASDGVAALRVSLERKAPSALIYWQIAAVTGGASLLIALGVIYILWR